MICANSKRKPRIFLVQVLACGGWQCDEGVCSNHNECYYFGGPSGNAWTPAPSMTRNRFNFMLAYLPHVGDPTGPRTAVTIGYGAQSEWLEMDTEEWVGYYNLPNANWWGLSCLVQYNNRIYHVKDTVEELNAVTWSVSDLSTPPDRLLRPGTCVMTTINGNDGIFTRQGYFYDLTDNKWTRKAFPDFDPIGDYPNSIFLYQGRPTIFGNTVCDALGECENKEIIQYNADTDSWSKVGDMLQSRTYHTAIPVPRSMCDLL